MLICATCGGHGSHVQRACGGTLTEQPEADMLDLAAWCEKQAGAERRSLNEWQNAAAEGSRIAAFMASETAPRLSRWEALVAIVREHEQMIAERDEARRILRDEFDYVPADGWPESPR